MEKVSIFVYTIIVQKKIEGGVIFLKLSKKALQKISVFTVVLYLLNPAVGSVGVFASEFESLNSSQTQTQEKDKVSDLEKTTTPVTEKNQQESQQTNRNDEPIESVHSDEENKETDGKTNKADVDSDPKTEVKEESSEPSVEDSDEEADFDENQEIKEEDIFSIEDVRKKALEMMEKEKNTFTTFSTRARVVSKTDAFINAVSSSAVNIAKEYNLYPSVMIAQAALESAWGTSILAYSPNHNLFGIKGEYNGQYFSKYTKEYDENKGWITIKADFKKYPSYRESLTDNADKLRNGVSWDKNYYKGTWRENTNSYKDATAWLTGRYATDPEYGEKLNRIINTYDLTKFDSLKADENASDSNMKEDLKNLSFDEIISTTDVTDYKAYINGETDGIYTMPKGTNASSVVASSAEFFDREVTVTKESKTKNGLTWVLIHLNGKELGWIEKNGVTTFDIITSTKDSNYKAIVNRSGDTLDTKPWGTKGFKTVGKTDSYLGKEVTVLKEAITYRATWALIKLPNNSQVWVDKAALDVEKAISSKNTDFKAIISRAGDTFNTAPWGTEGFKTIGKSDGYVGREVTVIKEAVTRRATWSLVRLPGGKEAWIDKKALDIEKIESSKNVNYKGIIIRSGDTINTAPWGTEGYRTIAKSDAYVGQEVDVLKEATTRRADWLYISINGKELGWIDATALDTFDVIESSKSVDYKALISRSGDTLDTKPWGTKGFETVGKSENYLGQEVTVLKEAVTYRATWSLVRLPGGKEAWIDKKALDIEKIESSKNVEYKALIARKGDSLNTAPWGIDGYKTVGKSDDYVGTEVTVIKEAVTRRATWSLVRLPGGKEVWIDKKALDIEKIISNIDVTDYKARIIRSGDTINTKPWGTEGFKTVTKSDNYTDAEVTVLREATTRRATWLLISLNGKQLGWIDKSAVEKINPQKNVVVLDVGHGGKDPGAQAGGVREKDLNLAVAKKVQQRLLNSGFEVIMTRTTDKFLELSEIASVANKAKPDVFVSIHTNAVNGLAYGIETYSYNANGSAKNPAVANNPTRLLQSSLLSSSIQNSLISSTGAYNRGAKKANFHVIRETNMPAVLVEIGFIDNANERAKLKSDSYQNKLADGITQGIKNYFNQK